MDNENKVKSRRGFASWAPEKQKEVSSLGGRAAHLRGHAHQYSIEEARANGRIGGAVVSLDREHMAAIGRKGGVISGIARRMKKEAEEEDKKVSQAKRP
jgi:uncharacterized protein